MSPASRVDQLWQEARPDAAGLVACVVQDLASRAVLMVGWVSREALARTLATGYATFWSRSRQALWEKGETSGNRQRVVEIRLDCDGDTLLYLVEAKLPVCHEGTDTCFSRQIPVRPGDLEDEVRGDLEDEVRGDLEDEVRGDLEDEVRGGWARAPATVQGPTGGARVLEDLETIIAARAVAGPDARPSYTRQLLDAGVPKQVAKVREEGEELARALEGETDDRVVSEAADVLYHLAVALKGRNISFEKVFQELRRRFSRSGLEEKASRTVTHTKGG